MAKAGPARAAGRLGPKLSAGRIVLGARTVRIEARSGMKRAKPDAAPTIDLDLGEDERLVGFHAEVSLLAKLRAGDRKTVDWEWVAYVEVPIPKKKKVKGKKKGGGS